MSEDKPIEGMTADEAKLEIDTTLADYNHPYWARRDHPLHDRAVQRMKALHEVAFPKEPTTHDKADQIVLGQALEGLTQEEIDAAEAKRKEEEEEEHLDLTEEERAGLEGLKREWGPEFDQNLILARSAVDATAESFGDELLDILAEDGLGNNPSIIRYFLKVGQKLKDQGVI